MAKILIIEDEAILAKSIVRSLSRAGHDCETAATADTGLEAAREQRPDLILLDMRLGLVDGLDILKEVHDLDPGIAVIIMTAYGSIETAVRAMKLGACDYLQKPLDMEELRLIVDRALEARQLRQRLAYYQRREMEATGGLEIVGRCPAMQETMALVERIARIRPADDGDLPTVLLLGETGTGKDLMARALHSRSRLAGGPFVEVDCTSLPRDLVESELFGHEKGAFTDAAAAKPGLIEVAEGGTLFLNEVGELTLAAQAKLLNVLESKRVRRLGSVRERRVLARIIAATSRNLERAIREGRFRQDLYYRLKVLTIQIPPLRERGDDLTLLAEHFLEKFGRRYSIPLRRLSQAAVQALVRYHWPGNVRELAHLLERALLLSEGEEITPAQLGLQGLPPRLEISGGGDLRVEFPEQGIRLAELERQLIQQALAMTGGNVTEAARKLGIGREALRYRIQKHAIPSPRDARFPPHLEAS
ncbi:MAG: sigma-54-dependent transcriptional regulator [Candidatus Methylomirabilales bacterium]